MKNLHHSRSWPLTMLIIIVLSTISFNSIAQNADVVLGQWLTGNGKARIDVYKDKSKYYGKIVWLKNPLTEAGEPKTDMKNPEEGLRDRPLLGLVNLIGFVNEDKSNEYDDGKIYDPESGKTYSCVMTLKDANTLSVRGYIGISLIGRTDVWTRVK